MTRLKSVTRAHKRLEAVKGSGMNPEECTALSELISDELQEHTARMIPALIRQATDLYKSGTDLYSTILEAEQALQAMKDKCITDLEKDSVKEIPPDVWRVAEWARIMALQYQYKYFSGQTVEKALKEEKKKKEKNNEIYKW